MANPPPNVHLHCAQCDAQIGIFENEWIHLTASYARPKEKGINLGTRIGEKTQVVPNGPGQREADGCVMVELFCAQCSTVVGQSCKTAPEIEQQYLVNQRFFKLSRIYLKNAKTACREEPVFVDGGSLDVCARSGSLQSNLASIHRPPPRNGSTPSFRQSYPPPSRNPQYEPLHDRFSRMPPPSQLPHQTSSTSPFLQNVIQSAEFGQFNRTSRRMSDAPDPFRPSSANGQPDLQHELSEHGAALSECFNRIVAAESRLARTETRVVAAERRSIDGLDQRRRAGTPVAGLTKRLEELEKTYKAQANSHHKHHTTIAKQENLIASQAQQLTTLTNSLKSLQDSMNEMRLQLEEFRSQTALQNNQCPNSYDVLQNLEIVVQAMKDARASDQVIQTLREKNKAIKTRLKTIFAAMGSVSKEDMALLEDTTCDQGSGGPQVLGKRKRTGSMSQVAHRKLPPRVSVTEANAQPNASLPTPESTQVEEQSLGNRQNSAANTDEDAATCSLTRPHGSETGSEVEDDIEILPEANDSNMIEEQGSRSGTDQLPVLHENGSQERSIEVDQESSDSAPAGIHEAGVVNEGPVQEAQRNKNQSVPSLQEVPEKTRETLIASTHGTLNAQPFSASRNQHPALYRSSFAHGRLANTNGLRNSGTMSPWRSPASFALSRPTSSLQSNIDPRLRAWKGEGSHEHETFSDALSRGYRLEDIIQRSSRFASGQLVNGAQSRTKQPTADSGTDGLIRHSTVLQPRQGSVSSTNVTPREPQNGPSVIDSIEASKNAEAIDFSDDENAAPGKKEQIRPRGMEMASTTPLGEPHIALIDRAAVSRTIRELTMEPLRRPVIEDHSQKGPGVANKRPNEISRHSVLPGFTAAIHNLNDSAARHMAASSSRLVGGEPADECQKASLMPSPSNDRHADRREVSAQRDESVVQQTGDKEASCSTLTGLARAGDNAPVKNNGRGRPRKYRRESDIGITLPSPGRGNDDNCAVCKRTGRLLCCDGCPRAYHHRCLNPPMNAKQRVEGDWFCPKCIDQQEEKTLAEASVSTPRQDDPTMIVRRKLAEEAMAREMGRVV